MQKHSLPRRWTLQDKCPVSTTGFFSWLVCCGWFILWPLITAPVGVRVDRTPNKVPFLNYSKFDICSISATGAKALQTAPGPTTSDQDMSSPLSDLQTPPGNPGSAVGHFPGLDQLELVVRAASSWQHGLQFGQEGFLLWTGSTLSLVNGFWVISSTCRF
jgi:hypothetical protein